MIFVEHRLDVDDLPPAERASKLATARRAARVGLKLFAAWLKDAGAPEAEIEALRAGYRSIPASKA